jgi:hydrogenase 3 maturation protease
VGKINRINPDLLVLVDCVDLKKPPGFIGLFDVDQLIDHTTNTHNISLKNVAELFFSSTMMLGIQPKNISFGEEISPEVRSSADELIKDLNNL